MRNINYNYYPPTLAMLMHSINKDDNKRIKSVFTFWIFIFCLICYWCHDLPCNGQIMMTKVAFQSVTRDVFNDYAAVLFHQIIETNDSATTNLKIGSKCVFVWRCVYVQTSSYIDLRKWYAECVWVGFIVYRYISATFCSYMARERNIFPTNC